MWSKDLVNGMPDRLGMLKVEITPFPALMVAFGALRDQWVVRNGLCKEYI